MTISPPTEALAAFAADIRLGLGKAQKALPAQYFYDDLGSQLFEAICQLPWYPITRAEKRLLERYAAAMVAPLGTIADLVELGSGSGEKLATVAAAIPATQAPRGKLPVHLIDISEKALELSRSNLGRLPYLEVHSHRETYEAGLQSLSEGRAKEGARLVLFLGSNIGNFDRSSAERLLSEVRRALRPGDGLLLGADLVRSEADLVLAYDDPLGVTAAFNKNLLVRMNRELGADFDLDAWKHRAVFSAKESRVEMHLVSRRPQRVRVPGAGIEASFAEGETIWTESSYKYTEDSVASLGERVGLRRRDQWIEPEGCFSTTLFVVA